MGGILGLGRDLTRLFIAQWKGLCSWSSWGRGGLSRPTPAPALAREALGLGTSPGEWAAHTPDATRQSALR